MRLRTKLSWIFVLYFAEGLPFGIVKDVLPVYFYKHGVSLMGVGFISLLGIPWSLKFLWSPLVDRFGARKYWIIGCLLVLAITIMAVIGFDPGSLALGLWIVLLGFTMASASQDIAIDAYTIGLIDRGEEGIANGVRVTAYRIALIASGGVLLVLAESLGWNFTFVATAIILIFIAVMSWRLPPIALSEEKRRHWLIPMRNWLNQPGAYAVFIFVFLYKLGDAAIGPMIKPFWLDRGLSVAEIGSVSVSFGVLATILGALLGGYCSSRWGIFHGLWTLGIAQALSNLGYAAIAWIDPERPALAISSLSLSHIWQVLAEPARAMIYGASLLESFTGGLGTAAFLAFLMRICQKEYAATQYALLSALFALSRDMVGGMSGRATETLGYAPYFTVTFFLSFVAFIFLPWVRTWVHERDDENLP